MKVVFFLEDVSHLKAHFDYHIICATISYMFSFDLNIQLEPYISKTFVLNHVL